MTESESGTNESEATESGATESGATTVAFVCVQNAGRSQMAHAFARCEREDRDLDREIALVMGGTQPAERVHSEVVDVMEGVGIDISDRSPREVSVGELRDSDYVITMGCAANDVCPAAWAGESRDWGLDDPDGRSAEAVTEIRDEIERRVAELFDELERDE